MAKHKKQGRERKQTPASEKAQEQSKSSSMEDRSKTAATPGDVARKHRERRFGHN